MKNNISARFCDIISNSPDCKEVFRYTVPHGDEILFYNGEEYIIVSQTLRGFWHLFNKIPYDFNGNVYIPSEFTGIVPARRNITVIFNEKGIVKLCVSPKIALRYDFASIDGKKNPVFTELKRADSLSFRKENGIFVLEEERLIKRAVDDGVDVKYIVYTPKSALLSNGVTAAAKEKRIQCFLATEGLLASVTQTRPVPKEMAMCAFPEFLPEQISVEHKGVVLIADNVENPDNLGLVIRTADACGADCVISVGNTSVYNKSCIRASRGAIGRFPVIECEVDKFNELSAKLKTLGYKIYGTSAKTNTSVYDLENNGGRVFSVSNETNGISKHMADAADEMLRIPMATGQSSLNVAVAAGIILSQAIIFD